MLNDAGLETHRCQLGEHALAEVALYQYLAATGTTTHTQRTLEPRRHILEGGFITSETGHNGCLLAAAPLLLQHDVKADLALLAAYIDTQDKLMVYNEEAFFAAGTGNTDEAMITAKTARVFGVFCKTVSNEPVSSIPAENHYGMNVAFTIAWLAHKTGSETAAYKTLIGVTPASLTQAEIDSLEDHCINYVSKVGSRTVTMLGKALGGEWLDVLRFRDWLKTAIQVAIAEVFISMPKVPFTDGGITLIHNALESVLKEGVESGGIAPTSYDANGNEVASYSISVPRATDISAATMATRKLSGITWSAITSSAIHLVRLNGTLTYAY